MDVYGGHIFKLGLRFVRFLLEPSTLVSKYCLLRFEGPKNMFSDQMELLTWNQVCECDGCESQQENIVK